MLILNDTFRMTPSSRMSHYEIITVDICFINHNIQNQYVPLLVIKQYTSLNITYNNKYLLLVFSVQHRLPVIWKL